VNYGSNINLHAVPFVDEQVCVKDGGVRIQVGRSAGHIFYGQPRRLGDHPTSTVAGPTTPLPTSDYNTIPVSSPGFDQNQNGSRKVVGAGAACLWTLVALPGQRIRLRVIIIDPWNDPVIGSEFHDVVDGTDTCPETLLIHDSVLLSTVRLPVCRGRQRDSQIYLSIGHQISIHVEQSGVHTERRGIAGEPLSHSASPTDTERSRRSGLLLTYECL